MAHDAPAGIQENVLRHKVTRADGTVVDLGIVAYWSKNPLKRAWWRWLGEPASKRRIAAFNRQTARIEAANPPSEQE